MSGRAGDARSSMTSPGSRVSSGWSGIRRVAERLKDGLRNGPVDAPVASRFPIRLVVLDLDGTLIGADFGIGPRTQAAGGPGARLQRDRPSRHEDPGARRGASRRGRPGRGACGVRRSGDGHDQPSPIPRVRGRRRLEGPSRTVAGAPARRASRADDGHRRRTQRSGDDRRRWPRGGDAHRAERGPVGRPLRRGAAGGRGRRPDDRGARSGRSRRAGKRRTAAATTALRCGMTRRLPDDPLGQAEALDVLRAGGLVAIPTDTVYGLAVSLHTPGGIEKLYAAKRRAIDKAIIVLVDGLDQLAGLVTVPPAAQVLGGIGWPGGLTLILPLRSTAQLPPALTAGTATLGVRVPDHPTPRALSRMLGPLPTTSANLSGEPDADAAESAIGDACELILDGGRTSGGRPSTIVDCSRGLPSVVRVGAVPVRMLATALDDAGIRHGIEEPATSG